MFEFIKLLNNIDIAAPCIPTPTLGGETFWIDLKRKGDYILQQNIFFHNARIIRASDLVRVAWGSVSAMERILSHIEE